ncbi:hypothetical protein BGX24_006732 [Mortierella sp. AD032]|nr:hypothetical protein BGX24_006732 [Mortierella sp. AD032]
MGVYVQTHSAMQQKARKKIREEGKVKRTSNCFIKYRTYVHPIIVAHFGPQNNKEISRLAGRWWKNEPEEVKSLYRQQAAEEKERHATLYPLYKYAPAKPAPKGDCSDSTKPKPQCPWNRPTRLSSPPAQLSSSPVLISPLPTPHDTEGKKQTEVHPVEGELTDDSSSSQAVAPDKSSTSAAYCPSLSKSSKERSFVVTETALFDFTGNANLNEKRCSPKSQSCSRPNRSHQRLSSMTDSLQRGISLASTTSTSGPIPSDPFAFVLQRPAVTSFPFLAGSKGVSGLTQALAQQRFDSTATPSTPTPIVLRAPASNTTSGWITMASRLQTSGISPQERWHVPQPLLQQACLATPVLTTLTAQPLNTVFQSNIGVSANDIRGIATDQNWAQSLPLSPQAPSPFLPHLATNLVQVPQISTPIQIPAPSVVTSQFSGPFSSPMYTPTLTPATARSSLGADSGFPWQLDANFGNPPDFGLLYSPPPHGSISCTPTALPSTPLMTMHIQQQGMISSSPMNIHPTLDSPHQALVASFEDELASVGLVHDMSSSQISDKMFDETTWNVKSPSCMPSTTTTAWEYPSLITNQCIVEFKQQLLLSDSGSNSSPLSKSPGPVYPEMDMSTWTTLGEPRVPSPICISDNNGTNNASDDSDDSDDTSNISSVNINDNTMDVDATSTSSSSNDAQVITLASQPATVQLTVSSDGQSSLAWDDEEQLKMSITYYEEIVQQQKMLLNLQRQWRLQAQVVQVSTASKTSPGMSLK